VSPSSVSPASPASIQPRARRCRQERSGPWTLRRRPLLGRPCSGSALAARRAWTRQGAAARGGWTKVRTCDDGDRKLLAARAAARMLSPSLEKAAHCLRRRQRPSLTLNRTGQSSIFGRRETPLLLPQRRALQTLQNLRRNNPGAARNRKNLQVRENSAPERPPRTEENRLLGRRRGRGGEKRAAPTDESAAGSPTSFLRASNSHRRDEL
jgi:hypothetical protein